MNSVFMLWLVLMDRCSLSIEEFLDGKFVELCPPGRVKRLVLLKVVGFLMLKASWFCSELNLKVVRPNYFPPFYFSCARLVTLLFIKPTLLLFSYNGIWCFNLTALKAVFFWSKLGNIDSCYGILCSKTLFKILPVYCSPFW